MNYNIVSINIMNERDNKMKKYSTCNLKLALTEKNAFSTIKHVVSTCAPKNQPNI